MNSKTLYLFRESHIIKMIFLRLNQVVLLKSTEITVPYRVPRTVRRVTVTSWREPVWAVLQATMNQGVTNVRKTINDVIFSYLNEENTNVIP